MWPFGPIKKVGQALELALLIKRRPINMVALYIGQSTRIAFCNEELVVGDLVTVSFQGLNCKEGQYIATIAERCGCIVALSVPIGCSGAAVIGQPELPEGQYHMAITKDGLELFTREIQVAT